MQRAKFAQATMVSGTLIWFVSVFFILFQSDSFGAFIIYQDVNLNMDTGVVDFQVTFNSTPDLLTVDSFGRQADSFQFFIDLNPSPGPYNEEWQSAATIVRAEEIHTYGEIPIRDRTPSSSDPSAGGWGPARGFIPFSVSARSVVFSVPMDVLGVTGNFSYLLMGLNYGGESYDFIGTPTVVPEPSALLPAALAMTLFGLVRMRTLRKRGCPSHKIPTHHPR